MKICDLHTHSIFSDGTFTPTQLVNFAVNQGVSAIALCDHNTVDGLKEFTDAAKGKDIEVVSGCEISTEYNGAELHVLGLFIDEFAFDKLKDLCNEMVKRKQKSYEIAVKGLINAGYEIDYEKIISSTPNNNINRTHIAAALIEKGYIESVREGFKTLLRSGGEFYTSPKRIDTLETIAFLRKIGAVPVIAHPFFSTTPETLTDFWPKAKTAGLVGIETLYPLYDKEITEIAIKTAEKYGFLQSGGSDFHGESKPDISLGSGKGNLSVPYEYFLKFKEFKNNNN